MLILSKIGIKKYISRLLFLTMGFVFCSNIAKSQDPIFSLFETTAMNFNPSHVGNVDYSRIAIGYRNQYPTYKSPFVSYTATYDLYMEEINSGFGVMIMRDDVGKGVFTTTSVSLAYSCNIRLADQWYLRGGLSFSYFDWKRDPNGLIFPDMLYFSGGIAYPSGYAVEHANTIHVGFGVTVLFNRFKAGAAFLNLAGQELASSLSISIPNPAKVTGYVAYDIPVIQRYNARAIKEDVFVISPYVRYIRQYSFEDIDIGAYFDLNSVFAGLAHRSDTGFKNSTFVIAAGFKNKDFNICYSTNLGDLKNATHYISAHEISLILKLKNKKGEHLLKGIYLNRQPSDYQRTKTYKCPY